MSSYDVVVAGLGAMGSAATDHLAARGVRVLGLDPFGVPHRHGSSGGDTRLIRKAYFEHPDYVPLLERAYDNWRDLEADAGEELLFETGTVYVGDPEGELIAGSRASAAAHGLELEELRPTDVARRFSHLRCPDGYTAAFEPDAGLLLCERAVAAQARRAAARGATIVTGERLLDWQPDGAGLVVRTDRRRYRAGGLVLTLGSWSAPQLAGIGVTLEVTRQPLFWLATPTAEFELGRSPCWAVQRSDRAGLLYGFPALPAALGCAPGVKAAHHDPGRPVDPDAPRDPATAEELGALLADLEPFVPALAGPMTASHVCLYTNSADGHFVVDRHPDHGAVVFGCGFSGHGFKFASVMGEALADLVTTGRSSLPIDFLRRR